MENMSRQLDLLSANQNQNQEAVEERNGFNNQGGANIRPRNPPRLCSHTPEVARNAMIQGQRNQ